jgi:hypothetical protein
MSKHGQRIPLIVLVLGLAAITCNVPLAAKEPVLSSDEIANAAAAKVMTAEAAKPSTALVVPVAPVAASATTQCSPTVTANTVANIRSGPGTLYDIVGNLPTGAAAAVAGRDATSAWWYIQFAGGYGGYAWIAASVVTPACIPALMQVVAAPPLPTSPPPTETQKVALPTHQLQPWLFLEIVPTATPKWQLAPYLHVTFMAP